MKTVGWPRPRGKCWGARRSQDIPGYPPGVAVFPWAVGRALGCAWPWLGMGTLCPACPQWLQWPVLPERAHLASRWESTKEAWKWVQWSQAFSFPPFKGWKHKERCHKSICFGREGGKKICGLAGGQRICAGHRQGDAVLRNRARSVRGAGDPALSTGEGWRFCGVRARTHQLLVSSEVLACVLQGIPFLAAVCVCARPCVCFCVCVLE